ncbi:hypothetical protein DFH06DRAFT_1303341 [Mycena polygramma]|nr:hypothetical protein DFH06DRAFT_1303341 [Mycena polygramma]
MYQDPSKARWFCFDDSSTKILSVCGPRKPEIVPTEGTRLASTQEGGRSLEGLRVSTKSWVVLAGDGRDTGSGRGGREQRWHLMGYQFARVDVPSNLATDVLLLPSMIIADSANLNREFMFWLKVRGSSYFFLEVHILTSYDVRSADPLAIPYLVPFPRRIDSEPPVQLLWTEIRALIVPEIVKATHGFIKFDQLSAVCTRSQKSARRLKVYNILRERIPHERGAVGEARAQNVGQGRERARSEGQTYGGYQPGTRAACAVGRPGAIRQYQRGRMDPQHRAQRMRRRRGGTGGGIGWSKWAPDWRSGHHRGCINIRTLPIGSHGYTTPSTVVVWGLGAAGAGRD